MRKIDLIVVHCSATRCNRSYPVETLIADHQKRLGQAGYHYYVTCDGHLYQTLHENLKGAHARGYNAHSIGVCYEGGLNPQGIDADTRTEAQKKTLLALLCSLKLDYPDAVILGHRDLPKVKKRCPCFDARTEYQDL